MNEITKFQLSNLELIEMNFNEILRIIEELTPEQKLVLAQKLSDKGLPLSIVMGDYNFISNSFVLQLSGDSDKISERLKELSPDTLQKLVEAIAIWISNNKKPNH